MNPIYFDNSATTALSDSAKNAMVTAMDIYGNPSSLHTVGLAGADLLKKSRTDVLSTIKGANGDLIFTGCGSEGNNIAILGTAKAKDRFKGGTVIATDSEHPSVENCLQRLEKEGFVVRRLSTKNGILDLDEAEKYLSEKVFLVSAMQVNNETGARYDVESLFRLAKAKNPEIVTHCDGVQGYLKTPIDLKFVDFYTLSAHKIHGPKGVGGLYYSKAVLQHKNIAPTLLGGGQENGFRSGTENTTGIAGFSASCKEGYLHFAENAKKMEELRIYAEEKLSDLPVKLHIPNGKRAPHILNFALPDIKSETMVHFLSQNGICVSAGSACSSHGHGASRTLLNFGISPKEADCSLRLSFSPDNTKEEIDIFVEKLNEGIDRLVRF